jgi:hypothetical protein
MFPIDFKVTWSKVKVTGGHVEVTWSKVKVPYGSRMFPIDFKVTGSNVLYLAD